MNISRFLFFAGPIFFILSFLIPLPLNHEQQLLAGTMLLTISWWLSPTIPLPVTGIIAVCLCVLTGVSTFTDALTGFANPVIFLFMGGFFMAEALHRQKLDQWIAQKCLSSAWVKGKSRRVMIMTVVLTAIFSAFLSNTATTAMFMPISLSLIHHLNVDNDHPASPVLLMIAYAATIGGIITPIGTPPNVLATSLLDKLVHIQLGFLPWMGLMLPTAILVLLGLIFVFRKELAALPDRTENIHAPPPLTPSQKRVFAILLLAMTFWILPSAVSLSLGSDHGLAKMLAARLPEGLVGLFCGSLLFFIPDSRGSTLLTWENALNIDWGTLILFGAGISLGEIVFKTKLAEVIGASLPFHAMPFAGALLLLIFLTVFGSEFVSNTALANLLIPLTVATPPFSHSPLIPVLAVTLGSSLAFMMPVGTPPNAIAYGTGLIKLKVMLKKGFMLNILSIVVILFMSLFYFPLLT